MAVAMLLAMGVAHADKIADAKQHYLNGAKAFELGEFQRAIDEYRASYDLSRRPLLLYDLGQAYRKLGNHELALHSYKQFLARSTEARELEYRETAMTQVEQLEALISEKQKVNTAPPDGVTSPEPEKTIKPPAEPPPPVEKPTPIAVKPPVVEARPVAVVRDATPARVPVYKRWWFWTILGGVVVAGAIVGIAVGLTQSSGGSFNANLGTVGPGALTVRF